jgi:hypothetical protein
MVTQEFSLVETMTVAENVALSSVGLGRVDVRRNRQRVTDTMERLGVHIEPDRLVSTLSIGERQRVEIDEQHPQPRSRRPWSSTHPGDDAAPLRLRRRDLSICHAGKASAAPSFSPRPDSAQSACVALSAGWRCRVQGRAGRGGSQLDRRRFDDRRGDRPVRQIGHA